MDSIRTLDLSGNGIADISSLAGLKKIQKLNPVGNQIINTSSLADLTILADLDLSDNQISDIEPLLDNTGFGYFTEINLENNPLNEESLNKYMPQLKEKGVIVIW